MPATTELILDENQTYALLTLESNPGVRPGEFGRLLYGNPSDKISRHGRAGGAALHKLLGLGLARFQWEIEKQDWKEDIGTGRYTSWVTTLKGGQLAAKIRDHHRQQRAEAPAVSSPSGDTRPGNGPGNDCGPNHQSRVPEDGGLPPVGCSGSVCC